MTIEDARQLLEIQARFGGSYNRNCARLILAEVHRVLGAASVDELIRELALDEIFGFEPENFSTNC
jgi:hypothetical protein